MALLYFLGIEVNRTEQGIFLFQSKYISEILHASNMQGSKGVLTLMCSSQILIANSGATPIDAT